MQLPGRCLDCGDVDLVRTVLNSGIPGSGSQEPVFVYGCTGCNRVYDGDLKPIQSGGRSAYLETDSGELVYRDR